MRKTRMLAFALVVMVMLMGAGYAAWTDKLTINSTVQAGELNVDFTKAWNVIPLLIGTDGTDKHYMKLDVPPTISADKKTLTVGINNMYPNTLALLAARFDNNGTIPAVINDVEVKFNEGSSELLKSKLIVAGGYVLLSEDNKVKRYNVFVGTLGQLASKLSNMLKDVRMEKGDYIVFDIPEDEQMRATIRESIPLYNINENNCILFYLPSDVGDNLEKQKAVFDIKINFKQHN